MRGGGAPPSSPRISLCLLIPSGVSLLQTTSPEGCCCGEFARREMNDQMLSFLRLLQTRI